MESPDHDIVRIDDDFMGYEIRVSEHFVRWGIRNAVEGSLVVITTKEESLLWLLLDGLVNELKNKPWSENYYLIRVNHWLGQGKKEKMLLMKVRGTSLQAEWLSYYEKTKKKYIIYNTEGEQRKKEVKEKDGKKQKKR